MIVLVLLLVLEVIVNNIDRCCNVVEWRYYYTMLLM